VVRALKQDPRVVFSVSATTRRARPDEREGVDYHFLSAEEFAARVERGAFLEWAEYNGNRYGTLRAPMEAALAAGRVFVLEIEVDGTRQLRAQGMPGLYVFIVPPDLAALRRRLARRGQNSADDIEQRIAIAREEMKAADLYDHVVVNRDLAATVKTVKELIGL
jgi:guanylate kinase